MPDVTTVPGPGGRHYLHPVEGTMLPGVTTILNVLDKPAIPRWAAREAATFAVDNREGWQGLERDAAVQVIKGAPWRIRDAAGSVGTDAHSYAHHRLITGITPDPQSHSEELVDLVLAELNPVPVYSEATVLSTTVGYAGTFDGLWSLAGKLYLIDWKSGSGVWPEVALQLSAYANAPHVWDTVPEQIRRMPPVDGALVIHVPKEGPYAIHQVRLTEAHWSGFRAARRLWWWRTFNAPDAIGQATRTLEALERMSR